MLGMNTSTSGVRTVSRSTFKSLTTGDFLKFEIENENKKDNDFDKPKLSKSTRRTIQAMSGRNKVQYRTFIGFYSKKSELYFWL